MMTRREMLAAAGSAGAFFQSAGAQPRVMQNMGVASTSFGARIRAGGGGRGGGRGAAGAPARAAVAPIMPPFDIVAYAREVGVGMVETNVNLNDAEAVRKFRLQLDANRLRAILSPRLPAEPTDVPAFDSAVKAAKDAGIFCLHAALTPRRYEEFDTLPQYFASFARNQRMVELAEPVLARHQIRLAIENHKGWRAVEQAAWLKRVSSEWVRAHLDFGNNISFCEDPMDTLQILLPYIVSSHIKDMAVEPYEEGFTLSEVPLGEGFLDIKAMVAAIQKQNPNAVFDLEMMTREPLKIPVFTAKYWATFEDIPGRDLAHMLEIVHKHKPAVPVPHPSGLPLAGQVKLEEANNRKSIDWARQNLNI